MCVCVDSKNQVVFVFNRFAFLLSCIFEQHLLGEWFRVFRKYPERQLLETGPKLQAVGDD